MERRGLSLIEVIIAIGLVCLLFGGIYASYVSIVDVVTNSGVRTEAAAIVANEIEIIRNLPYDQVGTQGGVPSGALPQQKTVTSTNGLVFLVKTYIRNIDDPFDGTLGGTPNDTSPNDYKMVELSAQCLSCSRSIPLVMTTTVAPKNLESGSSDGSLFVNVLDASGQGVATATIRVVNASVTPSIDLTDTTNASGVLQLIGTPTSTQGYAIIVTKSGYSSERTYLPGSAENPEPSSQYTHASVVAQAISSKTFFIDKLSTATIKTIDTTCRPAPSQPFSLAGQKVIGNNVLKFSSSSTTDANGQKIWSGLEWDIYSVTSTGSSYDVLGTIPFTSFTLNPNSTIDFSFIMTPASPETLLVTVLDAGTGSAIPSSTVTLIKSGFSETKKTARSFLFQTDWSSNNFESQDGGIDRDSVPGTIRLMDSGSGYSTTTTSWLISRSFDIGSSTGNFYTLSWQPESQPAQTGADSLKFQIASNNDNATWNFEGPDGTALTYYVSSSQVISANHTNHRYIRYKAFLSTLDSTVTPTLSNIEIEFYGACVSPSQALFQGLTSGTYTVTAEATNYTATSTSVVVGSDAQKITIFLSP